MSHTALAMTYNLLYKKGIFGEGTADQNANSVGIAMQQLDSHLVWNCSCCGGRLPDENNERNEAFF